MGLKIRKVSCFLPFSDFSAFSQPWAWYFSWIADTHCCAGEFVHSSNRTRPSVCNVAQFMVRIPAALYSQRLTAPVRCERILVSC